MVVTYRNGNLRLVFRGELHSVNGYDTSTISSLIHTSSLDRVKEDLTSKNAPNSDIVKVTYMDEVLWEREEPLTKEQLRIKELEEGIASLQEELNKLL